MGRVQSKSKTPRRPAAGIAAVNDLLEGKYRQMFEQASDGIIVFDVKGDYREVNQRACEILGYGKSELERIRLADLLTQDGYRNALRSIVTLRQKGKLLGESSVRKKNGKVAHLAINVSSVREGLYVGIIRDVTEERKLTETLKQSEERSRNLVEVAPYPTAVFVNAKLVLTNRACKKFFSWIDIAGPTPITLSDFFGEGSRKLSKELRGLLPGAPSSVEEFKREVTLATPDGTYRECEVSAAPVQFGTKTGIQLAFVDITERKRLIRGIEESEAKYRQLIEGSIDAVSLARDGKFLFTNKGFLSMFGYASMGEVVGKDISIVVSGRDKTIVLDRSNRRLLGEQVPSRYEYHGVKKDGTLINVEVQATVIQLDGHPTALAYHRNITERKKEEAELQRRTRALELMREISLSVNQSIHLDEVLLIGLRSSLKALDFEIGGVYQIDKDGISLNLVLNQGLSEKLAAIISVQNMHEGVTGYVVKTMEPLVLYVSEYPPHLPYKAVFESEGLHTVAYVPLTSKGAIAAVFMFGTRKKRQMPEVDLVLLNSISTQLGVAIENATLYAQIKDSEERYRSAVEKISDIIYHASVNGAFNFISPNVETLVGYAAREFYGSPDLWRTLLHPDDRPRYSQRISNQSLGVDSFALEYRILPKGKASYRWVRDSVTYTRDHQGNILYLTGLLSDITNRVQLQDALVKSEELKTNVLESVKEGVVVYDAHLVCLDWNISMELITGIKRDEVVGKNLADIPAVIGLDELRPLIKQALHGTDEVSSEDIPLTLPNEIEPRYIWARYSPLRDKQGSILGVVGIITDVTSRRRLEHEAKESEQILRNVIDGMGDALMICDLQGKVWEVNREFSRITGYQRSKVLGMVFPYPWLLEEEMARFVKWIAALRDMNELRDFDMTWKRDDGHMVAMSLNTTLLRNALGEPVAMLNISRDISDRKRLALELEKKNTQIEMLNRIISKANATIDFSEIFSTIASEVLNLIHYDQINVGLVTEDGMHVVVYACYSPIGRGTPVGTLVSIDNTVSKLAIARQHGIVIGRLSAHEDLGAHTTSVTEGFESQVSIPIFVNERVLGTFNVAGLQQDAFSLEELAYLQPIADQIGAMIDRVRLFQRVSDDSKYIHNLLNSINSVVYTADHNHRITEVNKTWREFAGRLGLEKYKDENSIIGASLWDIVPQAELRSSFERVMPQLFERTLEYYSQEYDIVWNGEQRTYHIAINPMVINERVTGLVFTHTDITEIKRTEAEVNRRNKELVALNTISTSISKSLHLDEVLRVAAEQIKEIVGADMVLFYLREEQKDQLRLSHSLGLPTVLSSRISVLPASASVSGTVISQGKPLLIRQGLMLDERVTPEGREVFKALGIDSLAAIPLQSKDKVLGAMDVAFRGSHEFDSQEQQLLLLIGNQIGPAIENAVLYKEVQNQVQRITSLYMIGKGLTGALDAKTLLEIVYAEVSHAIPVEHFIYESYSDQHDTLTTVFEAAGNERSYYHTAAESPRTISVNETAYADTVRHGNPWLGQEPHSALKVGCRMAVPVRSKQKIVGVISLAHPVPDIYTDTHLRLLESIANLTEIALDKAMLYEDTINKSVEIQNRNKELDDFTYVVSHDLKEPLISIEGYSKILLKDYRDKIDEEGREYLGSVVQSSGRMKNLIEDLLTLSRVGRTAEAIEEVSVSEAINEIVHDLHFTLREKNVQIIVEPGLPAVQYNPTQLSMIFRNLISNAMKFNDKPDPRITIGVKIEPDEFVFSVADNGIGIAKQYFDRIFMIFQRLHYSEEFRGTGAGLTIVKKIIENHKGRIWLDSTLGQGSTFYFTVPKTQ
jgi:PAS domain S-box-containing protein